MTSFQLADTDPARTILPRRVPVTFAVHLHTPLPTRCPPGARAPLRMRARQVVRRVAATIAFILVSAGVGVAAARLLP